MKVPRELDPPGARLKQGEFKKGWMYNVSTLKKLERIERLLMLAVAHRPERRFWLPCSSYTYSAHLQVLPAASRLDFKQKSIWSELVF
jgi:hypothetical protein